MAISILSVVGIVQLKKNYQLKGSNMNQLNMATGGGGGQQRPPEKRSVPTTPTKKKTK
jgi:ribosomal protein L2